MALDISPVLPWIDEGGRAVIATVGAALATWVTLHVRSALIRYAINMAVKRAGGLAYETLASAEGGLRNIVLKNRALEAGANYLIAQVPGLLRKAGIEHSRLGQMVRGELGRLLAADPTVTVVPVNSPAGPVELKPNGQPKVPLRPHVRP
jgi:hypothetical protein